MTSALYLEAASPNTAPRITGVRPNSNIRDLTPTIKATVKDAETKLS